MKLCIAALLFITNTLVGMSPESPDQAYINSLPDHSLVKHKCTSCQKYWLYFFKTTTHQQCQALESGFQELVRNQRASNGNKQASAILLERDQRAIRDIIREILVHESNEERTHEYNIVEKIAHQLQTKAKQGNK